MKLAEELRIISEASDFKKTKLSIIKDFVKAAEVGQFGYTITVEKPMSARIYRWLTEEGFVVRILPSSTVANVDVLDINW